MATENFLTYQETDPNSKIAVTSSRITSALLARNENAWVYKDKTADFFNGNFIHYITVMITAGIDDGRVYIWGLTNTVDDMKAIDDASGSYMGVFLYTYPTGPTYTIYSEECDSGTPHYRYYDCSLNTPYYLKIVRDETVGTYGTFYVYIYSDSARTTLVSTLTRLLNTSKKDYRYLFGLNTYNTSTAQHISGYCENLTISGGDASVLPEVTQQAPTSITATTATGNGILTSLGLSAVTAHGHCWNTTGTPTTGDSVVDNGAGAVGAFTSAITGLTSGTRYYMRAYATNSYGTAYSEGISFIAGEDFSLMAGGNVAVVQTRIHYVGKDGKEYWVQGANV